MKNFILILVMASGFIACDQTAEYKAEPGSASNIQATEAKKVTTIQWLDSTKNLGKITEGEKIEIAFKFVNTGNEPLVIENVVPTCGCTVAEKPAPVLPGKEGYIKAVFDSHGRSGTQHKSLTVYANTDAMIYPLTFDVDVIAKQ